MRSLGIFGRLSVLALLPVAAAAAITITGKVVDETGEPVREVRVAVADGAATSDAAGVFRLEVATPGHFQVRAEHEGFFLFTEQNVAVDEGASLEIRMNHLKEL